MSQLGVLRTETKSDLLHCLQDLATTVTENGSSPTIQVNILDDAAIVNMLRPGPARTFQNYATDIFMPYITSQLHRVSRLDIVWDVYVTESLKSDTRNKRGKGARRHAEPLNAIPGNWPEFLRVSDNKTELFSFMAKTVVEIDTDKQVITTHNSDVLCTNRQDVSGLAPCSHEEADTRILLHLEDAVRHGNTRVSIRTVDTGVVVLAVASAQRLSLSELWIAFGTGKNFRFLACHEMARALGPNRCIGLSLFHAFTGCDTVSFF